VIEVFRTEDGFWQHRFGNSAAYFNTWIENGNMEEKVARVYRLNLGGRDRSPDLHLDRNSSLDVEVGRKVQVPTRDGSNLVSIHNLARNCAHKLQRSGVLQIHFRRCLRWMIEEPNVILGCFPDFCKGQGFYTPRGNSIVTFQPRSPLAMTGSPSSDIYGPDFYSSDVQHRSGSLVN
jgi:hypothetical protein